MREDQAFSNLLDLLEFALIFWKKKENYKDTFEALSRYSRIFKFSRYFYTHGKKKYTTVKYENNAYTLRQFPQVPVSYFFFKARIVIRRMSTGRSHSSQKSLSPLAHNPENADLRTIQ